MWIIKKFYVLVFSLITLFLFSCRSNKDLIFMKNISDYENISVLNDTTIEYLVKPGDILFISIKSINSEVNSLFNPESNMESQSYASYQKYTTPQGAYLYGYEINTGGTIDLPILGSISVANNSQKEVEKIVQKKADQYLKEAIVKVKLLSYKVTVLGEVKSPGEYYNYKNSFTVFEALAKANGNTDFANIKQVLVLRPRPEGNTAYRLNLRSKDVWTSEAFYLKPNDYVFVEPVKQKNLNLNSQAYSMFFSSISVLLAVLGFVLK